MHNTVKTHALPAETAEKIARTAKSIEQYVVAGSNIKKEIGDEGVERLESLRRQLAKSLKGMADADVTIVRGVDEIHLNSLTKLAHEVLLPKSDSLCAYLDERNETGQSTLLLANTRRFSLLGTHENKYMMIESNKLGSDVRSIFENSRLLFIK